MLQSAGDLRRMRGGVKNRMQPLFGGFEKMRDDPHSQLTYQPRGASAEVGRNPNVRFGDFDSDSNAAYQCALMGHLMENAAYFELCSHILDDWAATVQRITGADAILCAALGGFKMTNAAELLRWSSAQWSKEGAERFGRMLRDVVLPVIYNFAPFANGNWDTAAVKTMMAIAIYTDDRPLFDRALLYYLHGCGDGSLPHYIYPNGQCQESGRDQQHTQLGLAHMGDCCEMAWHQGLDLYGALNNRLLLGFEYTASYILGEDVPFEPDEDRTGKYRHSVIAPRSGLRNNFEQIYNHYAKRRGLPAPWTQRATQAVRPEGPGFQADATGFGTLLYTRDAGPDLNDVSANSAVGGLYATNVGKKLVLSWVPLAQPSSYSVGRTGELSKDARTVLSPESSIADSTVRPGRRYAYRVRALRGSGKPSIVRAVAGIAPGWESSHLGEQAAGAAFFDGSEWRLNAAGGTSPSVSGGSALFVHTLLPKDGEIVGRLSPQFASQALHAGIALIEETSGPLLFMLEPNDSKAAEHVYWVLRFYSGIGAGEANLIGEQKLQGPVVRYGRVEVPVWLRLMCTGDRVHAAFSLDSDKWQTVGEAKLPEAPRRAGMLLNSGLGVITTEVVFDRLYVR
jgi:hypothetical protein